MFNGKNRNGGFDTKTIVDPDPIDGLCKVRDVGISNTSELEGQPTSQLVLSEDCKMQTPVSSKYAGLRHVSIPDYSAEDDKCAVLEVQNFDEANKACRSAEPNVDERVSEANSSGHDETEPNGQLVMEKENQGSETKSLSNSKEIMEKGALTFITDGNKVSLISLKRDTDQSEDAQIFTSKSPLLFDNNLISSFEHTPSKDVKESG